MLKKILFLVTIFSASSLIIANDPLKTIAQEIDNDLQTCSENQECISKIDKHLISLKQLQDQLNAFHISQVPYAFPWESMSTLLGLNFAPAVGYLASKIYTGDTAGPKLISFLFTSL